MKKFYVLDQSGNLLSQDGKKMYRELTGKELFQYLQSAEGKTKVFHRMEDNEGNEIGVELPEEHIQGYLSEEWHRQYLWQLKEELGITILSMEGILEDSDASGEELLADSSQDLELYVMAKEEKDMLRKALNLLNDKERSVITSLYLSDKRKSGTALAKEWEVSSQYVNSLKRQALRKLKRMLTIWLTK